MHISPSFGERVRGALRLLKGRGDDAVVCSFCGEDRHANVGNIVSGPGVAICGACVDIAMNWKTLASAKPDEGKELDSFPLFEHPASLLPESRATLNDLIEDCAAELSSSLIGWSYARGYGDFTDGISVFVQRPQGANGQVYQQTFTRMLFWPSQFEKTSS
jgi:hypothetical protein